MQSAYRKILATLTAIMLVAVPSVAASQQTFVTRQTTCMKGMIQIPGTR